VFKLRLRPYSKDVSEFRISGNCLATGALGAPNSPIVGHLLKSKFERLKCLIFNFLTINRVINR